MEVHKTMKRREALSTSNLLFAIAAAIFALMYGFAMIRYPHSFLQYQTFLTCSA